MDKIIWKGHGYSRYAAEYRCFKKWKKEGKLFYRLQNPHTLCRLFTVKINIETEGCRIDLISTSHSELFPEFKKLVRGADPTMRISTTDDGHFQCSSYKMSVLEAIRDEYLGDFMYQDVMQSIEAERQAHAQNQASNDLTL